MKLNVLTAIFLFAFLANATNAQQTTPKETIVITGVRFSYPLVQHWINRYSESNPDVKVVIETRTVTDPTKYDILIEGYDHDNEFSANRNYLYVARFAIVPFANAASAIANQYKDKGLTNNELLEIFFHDPLAERKNVDDLPYHTVYTRLQNAAAPIVFARFNGYTQQQINGKAISGADEHLVKAVQKDSSAISYASLNLLFDINTHALQPNVVIIPTDVDGNKKISTEEKEINSLPSLIQLIEKSGFKNIPSDHLHLSVSKTNGKPGAINFLQWVAAHGQEDLHNYGFFFPDSELLEKVSDKSPGRSNQLINLVKR